VKELRLVQSIHQGNIGLSYLAIRKLHSCLYNQHAILLTAYHITYLLMVLDHLMSWTLLFTPWLGCLIAYPSASLLVRA